MCQTSTRRACSSFLQEPLLQENETHHGDISPPTNCNINLTLAYTVLAFAGRSLWSQSVLSTFVFLLRNDNPASVGFITCVMGVCQLLTSWPAGILADIHRRDLILKAASVIGIMAAILTYIAVNKESYIWLIVALAFWGAFWGTADTSLSALFADSVPKGQRSYYFTLRSSLIMAGNLAGPAAALILFALLGDKWTVRDCAIVVAVGNTLSLPALLVLWFMKDEQTEQENLSDQLDGTEPLLVNNGPPSDYNDDEGTTEQSRGLLGIPENRVVPILISAADILSGLGSGMSIRYFPIFFMDNLKLSPAMVQVLYILSPVLQTLLMHVGQLWSQSFGRCRVTVMYKWVGILCMFTMLLSYHFGVSVWVTCTLYILRTSFMNSTSALTKSVLMDSVPRSERGKWSALESVNMFSWSGSAALGGILVSIEGIMFNFCVTASIQLLATFPLVALFSRDKAEGANDSPSRGHVQGIDEECDSETAASSSSYDAYVERI